jgi:hypothetical protein
VYLREEQHLRKAIQYPEARKDLAYLWRGQAKSTETDRGGEEERLDGADAYVHKGQEGVVGGSYFYARGKERAEMDWFLWVIFSALKRGSCMTFGWRDLPEGQAGTPFSGFKQVRDWYWRWECLAKSPV